MSTKSIKKKGRPGRDRMVVGFTTTYAISVNPPNIVSLNPAHHEVYSIQHYVIMFVRAIRAAGWFSVGTRVSSTNITDCHDITEILLKVALNTTTLTLTQSI
jgi:hypothetical protein